MKVKLSERFANVPRIVLLIHHTSNFVKLTTPTFFPSEQSTSSHIGGFSFCIYKMLLRKKHPEGHEVMIGGLLPRQHN